INAKSVLSKNSVIILGLIALVGLSGCAGATGGLEIAAQDAETTAFGNVEVTATVENTADDREQGDLYCEVIVSGKVYDQTQRIAVDGNSRQAYTMAFDIPLSDYNEGGEYRCELK
ncbi:hypothetical protein, partial [Haloarcula marismortui]